MAKVTEKEDEADVKAEVKGDPKVKISEPAKKPADDIPESTKAEMEAGAKIVAENEKAAKAAKEAEKANKDE